MPAWLGPALGAAGSIAGGLIQSGNQKTANQIAALNYYEQQHANQEKQRLAEAGLKRQDEGVTTGTGTRSQYIPGQGYVTTLSPLEAAITGGQQAQAADASTRGVQRRRVLDDKNFGQQLRAGSLIDALLSKMEAPSAYTRSGIEAELRNSDRQGVSDKNNALIDAVGNQVLRQGGLANNRALMSAMSGGLKGQYATNRPYGLEADEISRNRTASESTNNVNLINALRGASSAGPVPNPGQSQADLTTASMQARAPGSYGLAIGAVGAPQMGESKTSYALPNVLNSLGSAAYGYNQYQDAQDKHKQLLTALAGRQVNTGAGNGGR